MSNRLENKVAIVTGSGRQIGKEIALSLAGEGANVVVNDIVPGSAESTIGEIMANGGKAVAFPCDVTDFKAAEKLIKTAVTKFGRLDILVNNVGKVQHKLIEEMKEDDWDLVINTGLKSTFNCTKHAINFMKEQKWGRIINASSGSRSGAWSQSHYSAAKAGVAAFTIAAAWELGRYGITCNAYCPFAYSIALPQEDQKLIPQRMLEAGIKLERDSVITGKPPGPEYIAPFITYLCTDDASDITGQIFFVSGRRVSRCDGSGDELAFILKETEGKWTLNELDEQVPEILLSGYINPLKGSPKWLDEKYREK
jgi:3-oxoacyl-[acyl-carrier protein] reductase